MKAEIRANITINLEFTKKEQEAIDTVLKLLDEIDDLIDDNSRNVDDRGILTDGSTQYSCDLERDDIIGTYNSLEILKEMRIPRIEIISKEDE